MAPATHAGASVERIDTHSAIVFLVGERAYKLKRAVRFDYLDFSTSERRRAMCDAELRLNRRTAPDLYRRLVPVTRERDGSLALGGMGVPIDRVVEMNRFPQEALLDQRAAAGHLDLELMRPLASTIAEFHAGAERRPDQGGRPGVGHRRQRRRVCRIRARRVRSGGVSPAERDVRAELDSADRCSTSGAPPGWCGSATATCTCATSFCSTAGRRSSMRSSSTIGSRAPTCSTTSRFCSWISGAVVSLVIRTRCGTAMW